MSDYPQDVISQAGEVCRRLDIKSTVTNCLPIMDAILAERERDRWRPTESAPRDGSRVLLSRTRNHQGILKKPVAGGLWDGNFWKVDGYSTLVRDTDIAGWQPLPTPATPKRAAP